MLALVVLAVPAATAAASDQAAFPGLQKRLIGQSKKLVGFTGQFKATAEQYNKLAAATQYDYAELWSTQPAAVKPLLAKMKRLWIGHNSDYERMEGIVAGTPSLVQYDVDIDAGASFKEDPKGAVSFSLKAPDGKTYKKPGALYNITEAALWGEDPALTARNVKPDLDGDGKTGEFGEVLPDAAFLVAATREFDRQSKQAAGLGHGLQAQHRRRAQRARRDGADDGRVLRRLEGLALRRRRQGEDDLVQRRLAPQRHPRHPRQPAGGLHRRAAGDRARSTPTRRRRRARSSTASPAFIQRIYKREQGGHRFTPQDADLLGKQAQDRAVKVSGQVSQAAAKLGIKVDG